MARKIPQPHQAMQTSLQTPADAVKELEILHPEREIELAGITYTVREYAHVEWLRLLYRAEPIVAELTRIIAGHSSAATHQALYELVLLAFSEHFDLMRPLVLQAAGMSAAEFDELDSDAMEALLMTWWSVNYHFFIQRASNRAKTQKAEELAAAQLAARLDPASSTQPLSPTATSAPSSGTTPADN